MRWLLFFFFCFPFPQLLLAADSRPGIAKDVTRVVHRVRSLVEAPDRALNEDRALITRQLELLTSNHNGLVDFCNYAFGPGLLYLDEFFDDMHFLQQGLASDSTRERFLRELNAIPFFPFASQLSQIATRNSLVEGDGALTPTERALQRIAIIEAASHRTLQAEQRFREASRKQVRFLKIAQSVTVLLTSAVAVNGAWHAFGFDRMSPRELVGFLFSVWAGNEALFWVIWERFKWIDPYKKWRAKEEYETLIQSWRALLQINPALSAQKGAAAATTKPVSNAKHADAEADAALEALFQSLRDEDRSNDAPIKEHLFQVFLSELEDGNGARAMRILKTLHEVDPSSRPARLSDAVAKVFSIRAQMERTSVIRQTLKATARLICLGVAVFGSNAALKYLLPTHLEQWRTVPNWVLTGLGVRRITPLVWLPHRVEALKKHASDQELALLEALRALIEIDPSGSLVERIAEFDSGMAAHQLVTLAAGDALATHPNGERTRKLWNVVSHELSTNHPSGSRVSELLEDTFRAQRHCIQRLLSVMVGFTSGATSGKALADSK
jgi:hypothetical protein